MRYWLGALLAVFVSMVQASSVNQFRVIGVAPNLLLVLLACWLVVRGLDDVLPMILVAGLITAMVGLQPPGLVLLALLPLVGFGLVRELHIIHSETLLAMALVLAASIAYEGTILLSIVATGGVLDLVTAVRHSVLPAAAVNMAITPFALLAMRLARPTPSRHRLAY